MVQTIDQAPPLEDVAEPEQPRRRSHLVLAGIAAVLLVVGTIGPPLFGRGVFLASDLVTNAYPWRASADPVAEQTDRHGDVSDTVDGAYPARALFAEGVRHGDLFEWNPYPAGGSDGSGLALTPFEIFFVVLPMWYAPAAAKLAQMAVAIGFTFLFCRRLGISRLPAAFAGLAFAGSGFMVMWTNWPHPEVAALIPALFWTVERFLQRPSARAAPPIAIALGVMLLGNFPAVVFHTMYVLVPYVIVRVAILHRESIRRAVGVLAGSGAAVVSGALLVAAMLLPFAVWLRSASGAGERRQNPNLFLGLESLITTVAPKALGLSSERPDAPWFGRFVQVETVAFVGVTTAILAILALALPLATKTGRGARAVMAVATIVIGWATFAGGEVLGWLQHLPGFEESFVGRSRAILGFTVAVLAAYGFEAVLQRRWPAGLRQWAWAVGVLAVAALVAVESSERAHDLAGSVSAIATLRSGLVLPGLVGLATAAVLLVVRFGPRRIAVVAAGLVPLLLVVESLNLALPLLPNEDRSTLYPTTPGSDFLAANLGHERIGSENLTFFGNAAGLYGLRSVTGHAFHAETWKDAVRTADPNAFSRSPNFSFLAGTNEVITSPMLDRLGTRWFAGVPGTLPAGERDGVAAAGATCEDTVEIEDEVTVRVPAAGGLRGLVLYRCEPVALPEAAAIEVETAGQSVPARLPLGESLVEGEMALPLPAEAVDGPADAEVRLTLTGADGAALRVAASPDGAPVADVVRPADDGLRMVYADDLVVYERTRAQPRIRWAGTGTTVAEAPERLDLLAGGTLPDDTVVLSDDGPRGSGRSAVLDIRLDAPTRIEVDVEAEGDGYLVVADGLQYGWVASIDGEPGDLVDADHAGVAVHVPEGRHEITLDYRPPGQRAGVAISVVTAIGLGALWLWSARRDRRSGATGAPPERTEPTGG